ncbi:hypothetical protein PGTUg99_007391 [Puccinia graminis f. sp. tritici]|uniref:Uncharacterized protein n=1 Tax=Puccinia graminis f. sp. tritici TaxID=56615 RepID=A0A5B0PTA6_PUCGR|nr:hypothetical protein PGTUg99_007391 [Puccinia graminis f. sp. tritici]
MVLMNTSGQVQGHSMAQVSVIPASAGSQILSGAEWVYRGILAGSEVISSMIKKSGSQYLSPSKVSGKAATLVRSELS